MGLLLEARTRPGLALRVLETMTVNVTAHS